MQIDDLLIDHLSSLSKLEFRNEERTQIRKDLERMLGFVDKLNETDTSGVEPLIFMNEEEPMVRNDIAGNGLGNDEALQNAPDRQGPYFRVPKVVRKSS